MRELKQTTIDEDFELFNLCKKGNVDAFEVLVRKYQKRMLNIAYRIIGSYEDACEVVQMHLCHSSGSSKTIYHHLRRLRHHISQRASIGVPTML